MGVARDGDRRKKGDEYIGDNCVFFFSFGPVSRFGVAAKQRFRKETMTDKTNQVPTFIPETNTRIISGGRLVPSRRSTVSFLFFSEGVYMCSHLKQVPGG